MQIPLTSKRVIAKYLWPESKYSQGMCKRAGFPGLLARKLVRGRSLCLETLSMELPGQFLVLLRELRERMTRHSLCGKGCSVPMLSCPPLWFGHLNGSLEPAHLCCALAECGGASSCLGWTLRDLWVQNGQSSLSLCLLDTQACLPVPTPTWAQGDLKNSTLIKMYLVDACLSNASLSDVWGCSKV